MDIVPYIRAVGRKMKFFKIPCQSTENRDLVQKHGSILEIKLFLLERILHYANFPFRCNTSYGASKNL